MSPRRKVHHTLAGVKIIFHWIGKGEQESERAIAINPGLAELHHLHAYVLEPLNRVEESLQEDSCAWSWTLWAVLGVCVLRFIARGASRRRSRKLT